MLTDSGFTELSVQRPGWHSSGLLDFLLPFTAPEVLNNAGYDRSLDMWSVGVIIYVRSVKECCRSLLILLRIVATLVCVDREVSMHPSAEQCILSLNVSTLGVVGLARVSLHFYPHLQHRN